MAQLRNKVFCLLGPTATGKTALALELGQRFPFEIISVDSGMIYRGLDIGTAKPTPAERTSVPHHLLDICDPRESYSAGQFRHDALAAIAPIFSKGRIPLLVGGTMLYFRVLEQGIAELPSAEPKIRAELRAQRERCGIELLYQQLQTVDPPAAAKINPNDTQRIERALEVFMLSGQRLSELQQHIPNLTAPYQFINMALLPPTKEYLVGKISERLQNMLQLGFLQEVEQLYRRGDLEPELPALRMVGYRQAWHYYSGTLSYVQMVEQIIRATRQLAKRQQTWLRSWPQLELFASGSPKLLAKVSHFIEQQLSISI